MAGRDVDEIKAALTGTGSSNGYVAVASTLGFYAGAQCWLLSSDDSQNVGVVITEVASSTSLGLRLQQSFNAMTLARPNYGRSDMSGYGNTVTLYQPRQFIYSND